MFCLLNQISMNAYMEARIVTWMQIAQTPLDRLPVLVRRDLLEMDACAQV